MTPIATEPLPDGAFVLRVLEPKKIFFTDPEHRVPSSDAFRPTPADVEDGQRRGIAPGLSVFDASRTTPPQAIAIREAFREAPLVDPRVFSLAVDRVRQLVRAYSTEGDVVRDPLTGPHAALPGASGHALILGLYEPERQRRRAPTYKRFLDEIASAAVRVFPADGTGS